jgi:putative tryptophan/tyrosine transport system substrate-binding protein
LKRRQFIVLSGAAMMWPRTARGQRAAKIPRIGYLATNLQIDQHLRNPFLERLRELGYEDGRNILIEYRDAKGQLNRFPGLAAELARLDLDLIFAPSSLSVRAVHQETSTVPIVSALMGDPVGDGYAISLAQPRSNVTGLAFIGPGLVAKRLELLKEMVPGISRVAALRQPGVFSDETTKEVLKEIQHAAQSLRIQVKILDVRNREELVTLFFTMASEHFDALITLTGTLFYSERKSLADLAVKHGLATMFATREAVEDGALMAYGAKVTDMYRRAADYVDKILKGAKAGDLPIEQPTKFELVINSTTAKALGLTIPPALLAQADEVIE